MDARLPAEAMGVVATPYLGSLDRRRAAEQARLLHLPGTSTVTFMRNAGVLSPASEVRLVGDSSGPDNLSTWSPRRCPFWAVGRGPDRHRGACAEGVCVAR